MHTIEIPEANYKCLIAGSMEELSDADFVFFAGLCHKYATNQLTLNELKVVMALRLLDVKNKGYRGLSSEARNRISENVSRVAELLDFLFANNDNDSEITYNLEFTRNFVPIIKLLPWLNLKGPAPALTDISFLQYKDANNHYRAFQESQNETDLNRLIAVLYRPVWFGIETRYKPAKVDKLAAKIATLPIAVRWAVFLFYAAAERYLRYGSIEIDGQEISLEILYTETMAEKKLKTPKYDNKSGLAGVALSLAGTGIFGAIDKVYKQNLYDVLVLLYKQRIEFLNSLET